MRSTFAGPQSSTGNYKPKLDPGKTVASTAAGSPAEFYTKQNTDLNADISKGASLKHVETQDKASPQIDKGVSVKKVDRAPFLNEVGSEHELKHVDDVSDRSNPSIDTEVIVKKTDRGAFLKEVSEKTRD